MQDELTLLLAKQGAVPRGLAFQAARRLGLAEFEWKDPNSGRVGKFHTRMAGEAPRGQLKLPTGLKESDLYRDPAQERINRDYYDRTQQIEKDYQQVLRDISFDSTQSEKNALRGLTSDMAPFEQNQQALRDLDRHMGQMRQYEEDELIQGTVNEEVERQRQRDQQEIADLMRRINEMKADVSLMNIRDYEAAERDADAQANAQRLKAMQQEQAVQPVYPEMMLPGLPKALRGIFGLLDRFRSQPQPPARQEPYFASGGIATLVNNRRGRS
jgi:hypothetical protein